jgi:hypothetical protein
MGVDPRAKTYSAANGGGGATPRERLVAAGEPSDNEVGDALAMVVVSVLERMDADPRNGPPKLSLALLAQGDWCCSLTNWQQKLSCSAFEGSAKGALVKLAVKLARGEEWKPLPPRGTEKA